MKKALEWIAAILLAIVVIWYVVSIEGRVSDLEERNAALSEEIGTLKASTESLIPIVDYTYLLADYATPEPADSTGVYPIVEKRIEDLIGDILYASPAMRAWLLDTLRELESSGGARP